MLSNRQLIMALGIFLSLMVIGTLGFMLIEDYSVLDGIYMTAITITTVGFGEVRPLSIYGRSFTVFLILLGFISLAFAGRAIAESFMETFWKSDAGLKKMKKKIINLKSHYIICGYGRVGASAVEHFREFNADFVIIESDPEVCLNLREKGFLFLEGDATRENMLKNAGIKSAGGLIALLNSDPQNLFIVLTARELNPTLHIISRADDASSENKILRAGADSVISPYASAGRQIAGKILKATGKGPEKRDISPKNSPTVKWISLHVRSDLVGKAVHEVDDSFNFKIIGLRRNDIDQILPETDIVLKDSDMVMVLVNGEAIPKLSTKRNRRYPKIVIIDDNPSILRLFSRLFQKAGFHPVVAKTGEEGLERIIKEKPKAVVVDFILPGISGIDVCRNIRSNSEVKDIKVILFTSDESPETRQKALETGADSVIIKSSDAVELINEVISQLNS